MARKLPALNAEAYTIALVTVTPPLLALLYSDTRAAIAAFLLTQIALGITKVRYS